METNERDVSSIAAEYFERVQPLSEQHNPYTGWGMALIQQGCKCVFDELASRHALTDEDLHQAIRAYQQTCTNA